MRPTKAETTLEIRLLDRGIGLAKQTRNGKAGQITTNYTPQVASSESLLCTISSILDIKVLGLDKRERERGFIVCLGY
jgi:hypothetical protein